MDYIWLFELLQIDIFSIKMKILTTWYYINYMYAFCHAQD